VTTPPFTIGLRLTLALGQRDVLGPDALKDERWRDRLTDVAWRDRSSRMLPADARPNRSDAEALLGRTFADHPMVNVAGRAADGEVAHGTGTGGRQAFVLAEVVVMPDLAPVPPGGEFPDVTQEVIAGPLLVHGRTWPTFGSTEDEEREALVVLEEISRAVPDGLWRSDG
jgi:hypothetical protein